MGIRRLSAPINMLIGSVFGCVGCAALIIISLFIVVGVVFGNNPFDLDPFDNAVFSRAVWLEDEHCVDGSNRRGSMAEDILAHQLHTGMTIAQVKALLNKPEIDVSAGNISDYPVNRFTADEHHASRVLAYYLGEELGGFRKGGFIDRAWLDIRFDSRDQYTGGTIFVP